MIPLYRLLEVTIYSLLIFAPLMFLGIYPFRRHMRFSFRITNVLVVLVCILQIIMSMMAVFGGFSAKAMYLIRTCVYAAFYLMLVESEPGKLSFTLLTLSNVGNLVSVCSKCLENLIFGDIALETCRWSLCLCAFFMQLIVAVPLYFYISKQFAPVVRSTNFAWTYLWVIPTVFYAIWFYHLYLIAQSSSEVAMNVQSTLFLVFINLGSVLICHTEVLLIKEKEHSQELFQRNHLLTMQKLQYDNLQQRIHEARQARHDIRHHTHLIREYLRSGKLQELEAYLDAYTETLPDSQALVYCEHYATNALLGFFARQAKLNGVDLDVFVQLPEKTQLPETTLSVVLGNLLENALEACERTVGMEKKITVRGKLEMGSIFFAVSNGYEGKLRRDRSGKFLSTKSSKRGMGLESVAQLVQSIGGVMEVEAENGIFRVFVLLPEQSSGVEGTETLQAMHSYM